MSGEDTGFCGNGGVERGSHPRPSAVVALQGGTGFRDEVTRVQNSVPENRCFSGGGDQTVCPNF